MLGLSTSDGFMAVKEGVDDMIKYLANEPSVGLYFVQQHANASMPYLVDVKEKVVQKIHEVTLHTEDVEDSIDVVRLMIEFGHPLAEEMIDVINKSLLIISKFQTKRGLIRTPTWDHQTDSISSTTPIAIGFNKNSGYQEHEGSLGYFSAVLNSAKQRAVGFRWPLTNQGSKGDKLVQPSSQLAFSSDASLDAEAKDLPVSSILEVKECTMECPMEYPINHLDGSPHEDYNKFKYEKEAKFEAWLQEAEEHYKIVKPDD